MFLNDPAVWRDLYAVAQAMTYLAGSPADGGDSGFEYIFHQNLSSLQLLVPENVFV